MKKVLFLAACALTALSASAQRASSTSTSFFSTEKSDAPIRFTATAGLNFANLSLGGDGYNISYDSRTAFNFGVTLDIPFLESLYLKTGLLYSSKGAKYKASEDGESYKETASPSYLEIPVLVSGRAQLSELAQVEVNVGPYFAYGLGGKRKVTYSYRGESDTEKYDFFNDDTNKFEVGLQLGAGVTLADHYYVGLAYQWGLTNIIKDAEDDQSMKTRNFMLSIGYKF